MIETMRDNYESQLKELSILLQKETGPRNHSSVTKVFIQMRQFKEENEDLRKKVVDLQARLVTVETKLSDLIVEDSEKIEQISELRRVLGQ